MRKTNKKTLKAKKRIKMELKSRKKRMSNFLEKVKLVEKKRDIEKDVNDMLALLNEISGESDIHKFIICCPDSVAYTMNEVAKRFTMGKIIVTKTKGNDINIIPVNDIKNQYIKIIDEEANIK